MNYDLMMESMIKEIKKDKPSLLLHACCAPCSSAVIERLSERFLITILFYNPNITEEIEYNKRLEEIKRFISELKTVNKVSLIEGRYEVYEFFDIAKGFEEEIERGARCYKCYKLRLEETAKVAEENNFDFFTTTLTLSPYKKADWINKIGEGLNSNYKTNYLYSDFKKKNGYKRSVELSKEYNLYRQDYCGCIYSKKQVKTICNY